MSTKSTTIRHNGFSHKAPKMGPYYGNKWPFSAMDSSPTMDGLTHHGDQMNSKSENDLTQDVLGPCIPWKEMHTFLFKRQFMVFLQSFFYDSNSMNH